LDFFAPHLLSGPGQDHTHIDTNYYDEDEQMKKVFKVAMCGCPLWFFWQGLQQQEEEVGAKLFLMGVSLRERLPNDAEFIWSDILRNVHQEVLL
jgi:hypothetical protein